MNQKFIVKECLLGMQDTKMFTVLFQKGKHFFELFISLAENFNILSSIATTTTLRKKNMVMEIMKPIFVMLSPYTNF